MAQINNIYKYLFVTFATQIVSCSVFGVVQSRQSLSQRPLFDYHRPIVLSYSAHRGRSEELALPRIANAPRSLNAGPLHSHPVGWLDSV